MSKDILIRRTAWVVLISFCWLVTQPLQAAIQMAAPKPPANHGTQHESNAAKQSRLLADIHDILKELEPEAAYGTPLTGSAQGGGKASVLRNIGPNIVAKIAANPKLDRAAMIKVLKDKQAQLSQLFADADAEFDAVRQHLIDKMLPASILARQTKAAAEYHKRRDEYQKLMRAVLDADAKKADLTEPLKQLAAFMARHPGKRTHTFSDPNKLPFSTPRGQVRAPIETKQGFKTSEASPFNPRNRYGWAANTIAAAGSLSGIGLPSTTVSATPTTDDLAETEDVQITPTIRDQAAALNDDPVLIHNWVRNNIEFIPSYGSIQGSELTFQSKRGNAFDTASLEIALLRAAGIPARYVYGTVQIPADKVMNWVGGVTKPEAAQSLLSQGGTPNVALISGGKIVAFKLEHVWVEAWVDYVPSRGAVNRSGDTWIPLDASFKQYNYTQGIDMKSAVPIDAQSFLDQIKSGATINETEDWIENPNNEALQTAINDYQTQLQTYIDNQNPSATVSDLLVTKKINPQTTSILMGTLPYKTVVTGAEFATMPDNLQHQFRFKLYASDMDRAFDSPILTLRKSLPSLAGKKITLSFAPATQDDIDLINSYLPSPNADGTPIDLSKFPSSLPGYLIHLKAEIRIDGQVVQEGGDFTMGQELTSAMGLNFPGRGWQESEDNHPIAGEYDAIGLDMQGISATELEAIKTKIEQTKGKLGQYQADPTDPTLISDLTKEDIPGDLLYAGILGFFASVDTSDQLAAKANHDIVTYRLPSYGIFQATAQPHYWFGIAQSVSFPGVGMDVDRLSNHVEARDADKQKKIAFLRVVGSAESAFEYIVPERLFANPDLPLDDPSQPQGISAVKAIAIAASQGQKIYTLNTQNQTYHASIINGLNTNPDIKAEITDALAAGKEVTVHQSDITFNGWTGTGYIILDPETGAGAYKIGGGSNGGDLEGAQFGVKMAGIAVSLQSILVALAGPAAKLFGDMLSSFFKTISLIFNLLTLSKKCPFAAVVGLLLLEAMVIFVITEIVEEVATAGAGTVALVGLDVALNEAADKLVLKPMNSVCR
ncbi:MAG: transglutaminase-like domain-containing protein [Gammaproteobacteria bacterium]